MPPPSPLPTRAPTTSRRTSTSSTRRIVRAYATERDEERAPLLRLVVKDLDVSENVEEEIAVPLRLLRTLARLLLNYDEALRHDHDEVATLALIEEVSARRMDGMVMCN